MKERVLPHILLCYDGTPSSYRAFNYIKSVFSGVPIDVTMLKVIDSPLLHPSYSLNMRKRLLQEEEVETEADRLYKDNLKELNQLAEVLKNKVKGKIHVKVMFKAGELAYDIIKCAHDGLYDGVVIGKRGLSRISTYILGGVSQRLIYASNLPVWLIRGSEWNTKFLVPFETSEIGLRVIDYVTFLLSFHPDAEITFFHSHSIFTHMVEFRGSLYELLKKVEGTEWTRFFSKVRQIMEENSFPVERAEFLLKRNLFGPAGEVIRIAKKNDFQTIVIGRKGRNSLKHLFLGSVSQKLISYFEDRAVWIIH